MAACFFNQRMRCKKISVWSPASQVDYYVHLMINNDDEGMGVVKLTADVFMLSPI